MKWRACYKMRIELIGCIATVVLGGSTAKAVTAPVANAGLPRYAAQDPVAIDGTDSYDPDESGPLSYSWRQVSGPMVFISGADTATPTISGFAQTDQIQECEFELVVTDGKLASLPDTVKFVIVPAFVESGDNAWTDLKNEMVLENDFFDPNKPTVVFFNGASGGPPYVKGGTTWAKGVLRWKEMANVISFVPYVLDPDSIPPTGPTFGVTSMTCWRPADMIIVFLSAAAPDYNQRIQTLGQSMGGVPAIDVALRLNKVYGDARYAVNHVSFLDATDGWLGHSEYSARVADFLANPVDGEQCWLESYDSQAGGAYFSTLNVDFVPNDNHGRAREWYRQSLVGADMNVFNSGVVAGAYWSVAGPGRNLQLASTPGVETYKFTWYGDGTAGYVGHYDEANHPARLPEPVTLVDPIVVQGSDGAIFTCQESENAVGYELLFGSDPHRVMDFDVISGTSAPPVDIVREFPFEETWWTIRVRDQYGSTIYADPIRVDLGDPADVNDTVLIGLVAHWPLDETEGNLAHDQAGENHASVYGNATWLASGGVFGGALDLDGVDDWLFAYPALNTGTRHLSVLLWIKGGGPNQAVMSQTFAADWLMASSDGRLTTELGGEPLVSEVVITDGDWHQIGVLLDGAYRRLYIDGVTVAEAPYADSGILDSGLNIGVGKNYLPGTYFSGLIDDIHIHNRALTSDEIQALMR